MTTSLLDNTASRILIRATRHVLTFLSPTNLVDTFILLFLTALEFNLQIVFSVSEFVVQKINIKLRSRCNFFLSKLMQHVSTSFSIDYYATKF